jgi:hypothetical protein
MEFSLDKEAHERIRMVLRNSTLVAGTLDAQDLNLQNFRQPDAGTRSAGIRIGGGGGGSGVSGPRLWRPRR